ncbi:MAG: lysylphosphatidylglycerol synthase transmembrane domain-containing protein [Pseudomonadota bacterium]
MFQRKKLFLVSVGLTVGAMFLWLALRNVDFSQISSHLSKANYWYAIPFCLLFISFYWLKAIRWSLLLSPIGKMSYRSLFPVMMVGFGANNLLPAHLGEFIRMYLLSRQTSTSNSAVLASIVLERIFDLLAVAMLCAIALSVTSGSGVAQYLGYSLFLIAGLGLFVFLLFVTYTDLVLDLTAKFLSPLPGSISSFVIRNLRNASRGLQTLRNPKMIVIVFANSLIQWTLLAVCIYLAVAAVGITTTWNAYVIVLGLVVFGLSLPTAPAYLGTIQLAFVIGLGLANISDEFAIASSVFYHALTFSTTSVLGLYGLHRAGTSYGTLQQAAQQSNLPNT